LSATVAMLLAVYVVSVIALILAGRRGEARALLHGNALGRHDEIDAVRTDVGDQLLRDEHALAGESHHEPGNWRKPRAG